MVVVDDNEDAANRLSELLRLEGYEAYVAYDGETRLAQIEQLLDLVSSLTTEAGEARS